MTVKSRIKTIDKELKGWMNIMANSIKDAFYEMERRIDKLEERIEKNDKEYEKSV